LLSDEVERLHIDLWHAGDRAQPQDSEAELAEPAELAERTEPAEPAGLPDWMGAPSAPDVGATLRDRISAFRWSRTNKP
jgi:hypothetical protein